MPKRRVYKAGDVIGSMTLIERVGNLKVKHGYPVFKCECECGRVVNKAPAALARRIATFGRPSASCCDKCEPGKGFESSDIPHNHIWNEDYALPMSSAMKWLYKPIVGVQNA